MTGTQYVVLAYAVGLVLLLGYSGRLWLMGRRLRARARSGSGASVDV
jgi:hypothetical protein